MKNRKRWFAALGTAVLLLACNVVQDAIDGQEQPELPTQPPPTPLPLPRLTAPAASSPVVSLAAGNISHVWANDGGDKVTREELRAARDPVAVHNSVWNGGEIHLFGARNEVVSFNLVLEAPETAATGVAISLEELSGPEGATITTRPAGGDDLFHYPGRNIELFYVRYLEIRGLSTDLFYHGFNYDERHVPFRCRRPFDEEGTGLGGWEDRPCHNKLYPEIAVPLELESPFEIPAGANQSIWGDIYIPKDKPAGEYTGAITVTEDGRTAWQVPVRLRVRDFTLPDLPAARTMLFYSLENIGNRYLGESEVVPGTDTYTQALLLADRHFHLAHRHRISLIDSYTPIERMDEAWLDRLNGQLFTPARGYDGPGVGVGNNVYSIGTYQDWPWQEEGEAAMWANADGWVNWFGGQSFTTPTDYFLYLIDEPASSDEMPQAREWAAWLASNPGPGRTLPGLVTIDLPTAEEEMPMLAIPATWAQFGLPDEWEPLAAAVRADPNRRLYFYNSNRPATGSFATEDDGVALRALAWAQYKKQIERWFYWESTYYDNFQGDTGETNVFQQAHTFGGFDEVDGEFGETGWNYLNGDGVLFYPGTDRLFPQDSYGVMGPFASLRLKHWRRGIQDVDYLALAAQIDPEGTAAIVGAIVPRVLWEVGVTDPEDPTWVLADISWSVDPDVWEAARAQLADIIEADTSALNQ